MPEEKHAPAGGAENIFGEMDVQFGDVTEAQEVMKTTNWWKISSLATSILMVISIGIFVVFGTDAYIKTAASDNFIFTTGLFTKGGFACNLVNGNIDAQDGVESDPCLPLTDLDTSFQSRTESAKAEIKKVLPAYLDRKLNSNVSDSALAKYILERGASSRIPYVAILDAIADKIAQTKKELILHAKNKDSVKVDCGSVSFVGRSISFSCLVDADGVPQVDPRITARIGVLTLLKNIQSIDNVRVKTYPRSLSSGGDLVKSSSNIQFDLEYLLDANQL